MTINRRRHAVGGLAIVLAAMLLVLGVASAQEPRQAAYGRHLAQECTGCHRIDGIDNGIPSIIGWPVPVFVDTIGFYQSGRRTNPVMVSVASSLDEKQVNALAEYFGSLPKPLPKIKK